MVRILDVILGRSKPVEANLDALFGLPGAVVTLDVSEGLEPSGEAGVCYKPAAGQPFVQTTEQFEQLLGLSQSASVAEETDKYGYHWVVIHDGDFQSLVNEVHLVNTTLQEQGYGPQLLCSVFGVVPGAGADSSARPCYLVYLFKRGTFYPFAPTGKERRDNELELRVRALLGSDLPVEQDLSRWFPLWDLPVR